jgi:hypothetical protein
MLCLLIQFFSQEGGGWFNGRVVLHTQVPNAAGGFAYFHRILYEDGDVEDLDNNELRPLVENFQQDSRSQYLASQDTEVLQTVKTEPFMHVVPPSPTTLDSTFPLQSAAVSPTTVAIVIKEEKFCQSMKAEVVNQVIPPSPTAQDNVSSKGPTDVSPTSIAVVIKEETRNKFKLSRKVSYHMFADRFLLARQDPLGIARLGGNRQKTYVLPDPQKIKGYLNDPEYPKPRHLVENQVADPEDFVYLAYNGTWQPNCPMFAGQPTAAVDYFPKQTDYAVPVFIKRTLTGPNSKSEGPLIGWEYVGNYQRIPNEDMPHFWECAKNFSEASKREIAAKIYKSYLHEDGYGRHILVEWRGRFIKAIDETEPPYDPHSLAAKCLEKGFERNMDAKRLCELLMEIDEFHSQHMIQFKYYSEEVYNYCIGGKTSRTKHGKMVRKGDTPATAGDWYNFAEANMLFRY